MTIQYLTFADGVNAQRYLDGLIDLSARTSTPYLETSTEQFYRHNLAGATTNVFALHKGEVIGYAALRGMDPWPNYLNPTDLPLTLCGLFLTILVDQRTRGHGVGRMLVKFLLEAANSCGYRYLFSTSHPDNFVSQKLLSGIGMQPQYQKLMFSNQQVRDLFFLDLAV